MSSLYNMVVGHDPFALAVLSSLNFSTSSEIPRFRDAYVKPGDPHRLVVFTRTGGGNREEYAEENQSLRDRPGFVEDYDDDFDSTFAHFVYEVPEGVRETVDACVEAARDTYGFPTPMERFKAALTDNKVDGSGES